MKKKRTAKLSSFLLVRITGVAPLAVRPGEQRVSAVRFAYYNRCICYPYRKLLARARTSTLNSCYITNLQPNKKEDRINCPLFLLVRITGVAPLAVRPGEQRVSAVRFAYYNRCICYPYRKLLARARTSTLNSCYITNLQPNKKEDRINCPLFCWCPA